MFFLNYQNQSLLDLKAAQSQLATLAKPKVEFLSAAITEFQENPIRKDMLKAQDYYALKHDITAARRTYIDRYGVRKESTSLTNSKLVHPFFRKQVKQKVNYLLSKEFSITSEDQVFVEQISTFLEDRTFHRFLKSIATHSIINGLAWIQVYYDEMGELQFKRIPTEEVIPFWKDIDHTELEGVIRTYQIMRYAADGSKELITKVEYHTTQGVWYFIHDKNQLKPDPDHAALEGHFNVRQPAVDDLGRPRLNPDGSPEEVSIAATWEQLPFIPFKYNEDEVSLLRMIKSLMDDYDAVSSSTSNVIQDTPDSIKVVRNYDGTSKEEFVENLNTFRTAFVSGDGDVTGLDTHMDIAAIEAHLTRLRKDIYEAGVSVDTQTEDLGNASGVALKFRYADLDMDMAGMAAEFTASLERLMWFVKTDIVNKGGPNFMDTEFEIQFNMGGIVDEQGIIANAKASMGIISDETIRANHPWVLDTEKETKALKKQKEAEMQEQLDFMAQQSQTAFNNSGDPSGSGE